MKLTSIVSFRLILALLAPAATFLPLADAGQSLNAFVRTADRRVDDDALSGQSRAGQSPNRWPARLDTPAESPLEARFAPAIVKLRFRTVDERDETCSGSYVSDSGAILTAMHCATYCSPGPSRDPVWDCRVGVNGAPLRRFRLLVSSDCHAAEIGTEGSRARVMFWRRLGTEPYEAVVATEACAKEEDVALLVPENPEEPPGCMPMASRDPEMGARVSAGGFATRTYRNGDGPVAAPGDGDGEGLRFHRGERVRRDYCVVGDGRQLERGTVLEFSPLVRGMARSPHLLQTTVDFALSSSGGPLFDPETGLVHGVASRYAQSVLRPGQAPLEMHGLRQECVGATFFASVSAVDAIAEAQGARSEVAALRCERRRIWPAPARGTRLRSI